MTRDVLLFLDGKWVPGSGGRRLPVVNPATEAVVGSVAVAEQADLDIALADAAKGFDVWRRTSPVERGKVLRRAAELLRQRVDEIAPVLTSQQGKTHFEAAYEVNASIESFEWFAEEARRAYGRVIPPRIEGVYQLVLKEPVGPVAGFVPWNFGMGQAARKVGAALAAGCSIILKGPEETPSACAFLVQALVDAGLPTGAVSLVFGVPAEISEYLIPHPVVRKVSFTGSTAVGKHLASMAGRYMKRITMELGGHSPVIVTDDVDIEPVAKILAGAKFRNAGQACVSPTRFLLQKAIYEPFVETFVKLASEVKVGDGSSEGVQMGPLANVRRLQAMEALIGDAVDRGARIRLGGKRIGNIGNFFEPTVLTDVPLDARIMNEEPFGPVALMQPFTDINEALVEANRLDYGLATYAFTRSNVDASKIAAQVEAGMVSINNFGLAYPEIPYGGIKNSGYGSEGGSEAIEAFLSTKFVSQAPL
ncbi:NAD-dependent succinate-semialdehyde dehydrogenase [Pseudochelatococcus sp. B33]